MNKEAQERFEKWQEDLERRLAEHLFKNPEKEPDLPPAKSSAPLYAQKWLGAGEQARHGDKVFVFESYALPGEWCVSKNGTIVKRFSGEAAYGQASTYAAQLLQE